MRDLVVDFITGMVKGALDNVNLKAQVSGEWIEDTRILELSIEIT